MLERALLVRLISGDELEALRRVMHRTARRPMSPKCNDQPASQCGWPGFLDNIAESIQRN
jgi:hypothetical protein